MSFPKYPSYKKTGIEWLGEVPEHWKLKRLRHLLLDGAEGIKIGPFGSQLTSDMLVDFGFKVYGQENVIADNFSKGARFISDEKFREMSAYKISAGDLLVTMMGTAGRCKTVPSNVSPGIMDSHLLRMRFSQESLPDFVELLIDKSIYINHQVRLNGKGSIMHGLNSSIIKELLVALPPVDEQASMLSFLDHETGCINALIEEQQRLIELLKEKRQAVISHAVTKGLDPTVPMKDSCVEWLGEVPAHWQVKRLKHLVPSITVGIVVEPSKYYVDDGVPALRSLNVKPGAVVTENLVYLSEESNELHAKSKIFEGDIVAVRSGQPGTAAIVPKEFNGANCIDLIVIRKPLQGCSTFIFWYLNSDAALRQFSEGSSGAIQQHFNIAAASEMVFAWPPASEQLEINSHLDRACHQLDRLISVAGESKSLLLERRSALISAAVTGKIDVRCWQPAVSTTSPELALEAV